MLPGLFDGYGRIDPSVWRSDLVELDVHGVFHLRFSPSVAEGDAAAGPARYRLLLATDRSSKLESQSALDANRPPIGGHEADIRSFGEAVEHSFAHWFSDEHGSSKIHRVQTPTATASGTSKRVRLSLPSKPDGWPAR